MGKLNRDDEIRLVRAAATDGDAWQELWDRHAAFIVRLTSRYAGRYARLNLADEVAAVARQGFAKAVVDFDPGRKVRFATLLGLYVRRFVLDFLRRETRLNCPDGLPPCSLQWTNPPNDLVTPVIVDASSTAPSGMRVDPAWEASVADVLRLDTPDPDRPAELVAKALAVLSPQRRYLVELRYIHGWDIEQIRLQGYAQPVTRERVLRDLRKALRAMHAAVS